MSEEIKGKCYQEHEPTPNNPCEIKTILCNDIEIPVEFLKQNFVTVDGKKYIKLQQENKQLKEKINTYENPEDLTLMFMYCDEKAKDKIKQLKEVIEEVREYVKNTYDDVVTAFTEDKPMTNFKARKELLQILDKVKGEKYENS